jgi:hypothetical protein
LVSVDVDGSSREFGPERVVFLQCVHDCSCHGDAGFACPNEEYARDALCVELPVTHEETAQFRRPSKAAARGKIGVSKREYYVLEDGEESLFIAAFVHARNPIAFPIGAFRAPAHVVPR